MKRSLSLYSILALLVIIIDRVTKYIAITSWTEPYDVTSWLTFYTIYNRGVSWSLLSSSHPGLFNALTALIVLVIIVIIVFAYKQYQKGRNIIPEVMLAAGAISNIYDRFAYGGVVDFIIVHYKELSWPVFNIADIVIVCSLIALFIREWKKS